MSTIAGLLAQAILVQGEELLEAIVLQRPSLEQHQSASHGERQRRLLQEDGWELEPEEEKETLETKVVSNGVGGASRYPEGECRHERETSSTVDRRANWECAS